MASKDNKTSKTARVMNLLSKKPDTASSEDSTENTAAEQPAASAPVPPVITSMAPDAAAADQIKSALELAFEEELEQLGESLPKEEPAEEPEPAPEPVPAPSEEPEPLMEEEAAPPEELPAEAPETAPEEEPEPVQEAAADVWAEAEALVQEAEEALDLPAETEHDWKLPDSPTSPGYINVMQVLVEEKAPKYIKMFGLCQCSRCLEDVKALTLNHLPPKYVVLEKGDMIPRLTIYEGKYSSDITAQLLHACRLVMDRPHHSR